MSADFPKHWKLLPLEDAMEVIIDYRGKTPKKTISGIALITAKIVKGGRILPPSEFIAEEDYDKWMSRGLPKVGDVVITTEAPLGEVAQLHDSNVALAQRIVTLRGKNGILNNDFLLCLMQSKFVQHQLDSRATGSTVKGIKQSELRKILLPIPPELEQTEIAKHIISLNQKVELNRQTNQTLEAIAQAIFKSWFVDFDPVKAKIAVLESGGSAADAELAAMSVISSKNYTELAKFKQSNAEEYKKLAQTAALFPSAMKESELGEIPHGWALSEIGKEVAVLGGGTPSTKSLEFWEGGDVFWSTPKDMSNLKSKVLLETGRKITQAGLKKISSGLLPVNTVLMSSRAPVGYLALAKIPVAINQGYIAMKCENILSPEFVMLWCEQNMDEIKQRASGTTFAEISKSNFKPIAIVVPCKQVVDNFTVKVAGLYTLITNNSQQSITLEKIRDSLLPRLLSGELINKDVNEV